MATLSRAKLNKARHKQGWFAEQQKEANEKRREDQKEQSKISEEDHKKRLEMLKSIGIIKQDGKNLSETKKEEIEMVLDNLEEIRKNFTQPIVQGILGGKDANK